MWSQYKRKGLSEMRPVVEQDTKLALINSGVSVSDADLCNDSPKPGDMIARNPKNHNDQWLVAKKYFEDNLELAVFPVPVASDLSMSGKCMNFGQAVHYIKEGYKVAREGWNGKSMFIFLVPGSTFKVNRPPLLGIYKEGTEISYHAHIDMKTATGEIVPWLASQSDMLSEDWSIVHA